METNVRKKDSDDGQASDRGILFRCISSAIRAEPEYQPECRLLSLSFSLARAASNLP